MEGGGGKNDQWECDMVSRDSRSSCSNCKTTATQLDLDQLSKNNISCYQLPVKFAVATGWVAVAVVRNQEFLQLVAGATHKQI